MTHFQIQLWFGLVGATLSGFLGGWDIILKLFVFLIAADYITGVLAAAKEKRLDSNIMFWGLMRKALMGGVIALSVLFDELMQSHMFRDLSLYFFIAREGFSMVENLGLLGITLPPAVADKFQQLQKQGDAVPQIVTNDLPKQSGDIGRA